MDDLWRYKQIYIPPEGDLEDKTCYRTEYTGSLSYNTVYFSIVIVLSMHRVLV